MGVEAVVIKRTHHRRGRPVTAREGPVDGIPDVSLALMDEEGDGAGPDLVVAVISRDAALDHPAARGHGIGDGHGVAPKPPLVEIRVQDNDADLALVQLRELVRPGTFPPSQMHRVETAFDFLALVGEGSMVVGPIDMNGVFRVVGRLFHLRRESREPHRIGVRSPAFEGKGHGVFTLLNRVFGDGEGFHSEGAVHVQRLDGAAVDRDTEGVPRLFQRGDGQVLG